MKQQQGIFDLMDMDIAEVLNVSVEEYVKVIEQRIRLAEKGELKIRPMTRKVYDPNNKDEYIPPKKVTLGNVKQPAIFDGTENYQEE